MVKKIVILSVILTISWLGISMAGTIQLPRTGQTTCYDEAGTQLPTCEGTGQDGEYQKGVVWPIPRFQSGSGTEADCIIDNLTRLMWQKNVDPTTKTWQEALDYVQTLNITETICGHSDWRLPNVNELESLINSGEASTATWLMNQGFSGIYYDYWSSISDFAYPEYAHTVNLVGGYSASHLKSGPGYVIAVRGITSGPAQVWQTSQTTCFDASGALVDCAGTGQDGEQLMGIAWPDPRFRVQADCITDDLTGLTWTKSPAIIEGIWQEGLDYAKPFRLCGYSDWRLPNRNELRSLIHYGVIYGDEWLNSQGFDSIWPNYYWSSTTDLSSPSMAWRLKTRGAALVYNSKTGPSLAYYTLLVRSNTEGTIGTKFTLEGSGFGSKKGKLLVGGLTTKIVTWSDSSITCMVTKVPLPARTYDIQVTPPKPIATIPFPLAFTVRNPQVVEVKPGLQGWPKDEIMIKGQFFSTKKGKVYLGYDKNGQPKTRNCAVKSWSMDSTTGESTIIFKVPKRPEPLRPAYPLYISNKVGTTSPALFFTIN